MSTWPLTVVIFAIGGKFGGLLTPTQVRFKSVNGQTCLCSCSAHSPRRAMLRVGSNPRSSQRAAAPPDCGCGKMEILRCRFLLSAHLHISSFSICCSKNSWREFLTCEGAFPWDLRVRRHARGDAFSRHSCQESQSSLHQSSYPAVSVPRTKRSAASPSAVTAVALLASAWICRSRSTGADPGRRLPPPLPAPSPPAASGRAGALAGTSVRGDPPEPVVGALSRRRVHRRQPARIAHDSESGEGRERELKRNFF